MVCWRDRRIRGSTQFRPVAYPNCGGNAALARARFACAQRIGYNLPKKSLETAFSMELLERKKNLAELGDWLRRATEGAGCIALLGGEAGIGKTALLQEFAQAQLGARVLWGSCDALFAPRPL